MKFKSYSEIENSYNGKFIRQIRELGFDDPSLKYFCFNKIDGSNFQCSIDENEKFIVGSRSNYLERDTNFQGWQRAMRNEDVENKLRKMKELIAAECFEDPEPFALTVYGELCGGFYRHPDVEKVKGAIKIQGRVDYNPDNMWVPFDILLRWEDGNKRYLFSQTEVMEYCDKVELPHEQLLFSGTLDECLNFPIDFTDTTGNFLWNLPIIEGNVSEGVVIKPDKAAWMPNGQRVILKNKGTKFKERIMRTPKEKKENVPLTDLELNIFEYAREYITESRMMSIVSKIGHLDEKMFGVFLGAFLKDMWSDFDKDHADEIQELEAKTEVDQFSMAKVRKHVSKEVSDFIRPEFVKLINEISTIEDC